MIFFASSKAQCNNLLVNKQVADTEYVVVFSFVLSKAFNTLSYRHITYLYVNNDSFIYAPYQRVSSIDFALRRQIMSTLCKNVYTIIYEQLRHLVHPKQLLIKSFYGKRHETSLLH